MLYQLWTWLSVLQTIFRDIIVGLKLGKMAYCGERLFSVGFDSVHVGDAITCILALAWRLDHSFLRQRRRSSHPFFSTCPSFE